MTKPPGIHVLALSALLIAACAYLILYRRYLAGTQRVRKADEVCASTAPSEIGHFLDVAARLLRREPGTPHDFYALFRYQVRLEPAPELDYFGMLGQNPLEQFAIAR